MPFADAMYPPRRHATAELLTACKAVAADCQSVLDGDDFSGMSDAELFGAFLEALLPAIANAERSGGDA